MKVGQENTPSIFTGRGVFIPMPSKPFYGYLLI